MKKLCCSLIAATVMSAALPCFAMTVYDPTNYAANLETKIQMIQQVNQSAQQLQAQIKDIQSLNPQDMDKAYNQVLGIYNSVNSIRTQSQAIGEDWSTSLKEWSDMNPDYFSMGTVSLAKFLEFQQKSDKRVDKTLQQALMMAGITSDKETQKTVQSVLETIDASNKADGNKAALQCANQLLGIMISENNKSAQMLSELLKVNVMNKQQVIDENNRANKFADQFMGDTKKASERNVTIRNGGEQVDAVKIK
jgi:P-type conjugative transfer protein TrbJ